MKKRFHRGVELASFGLRVGEQQVPLIAASVHYWRLEPSDWANCLRAVKDLGAHLVDTYIPWNVHETAPHYFDFGQDDPHRDVVEFVRLAQQMGLYVIARPGPHINAELTYFGIPEWIIWDPDCQARSPNNHPVMLPMVPFAFPVPSYASNAFHDEVARYFQALGPILAPLLYPDGPIVLLQVDNEGALYFRDSAYDQDYHPDAIAMYQSFLRQKYRTIQSLKKVYPDISLADVTSEEQPYDDSLFSTLKPPSFFDATSVSGLARHLDWSEFHEALLETALDRFAKALADAGLDGLPTMHNLPMGQEATPLNAARVTRAIDLVGLDYYNAANPQSRSIIARRTTELAVRCEGLDLPPFACEMGAGFPPFFPPLDEQDSAFTVLTALAYGLRGFNIYMAVERDRWIGAPIDRRGRSRPFASFWRTLSSAIEATRFYSLRRKAPVRILIPRTERRLGRAMHAFGPIPGAFFAVLNRGAKERCFEDDFDLDFPLAIASDAFARTVEQALEAQGVPYAIIGGEDRDISLEGARWLICATSGAIHPALFQRLEEAAAKGIQITLGPHRPAWDGAFRPLQQPLDLDRLTGCHPDLLQLVQDDSKAMDALISKAVDGLSLPTIKCEPDGIHATVHEDENGIPRVLFVLNPREVAVTGRIAIQVSSATDVLDGTHVATSEGRLEIRIPSKTVKMLALNSPLS